MFNDLIFTIYRQKNRFQMYHMKMKEQTLKLKAGKLEVNTIYVVKKKAEPAEPREKFEFSLLTHEINVLTN